MSARTTASLARVRLNAPQTPQVVGGEVRAYEYPHLYQIQAGDWRISYAVEQNRLAILVLEVLNSDGTTAPDPVHETLTRKMKVKLLDWPEGSPSRDLPPEDLGKKLRIKLLDMADELHGDESTPRRSSHAIRLVDSASRPAKTARIKVLADASETDSVASTVRGDASGADTRSRKGTPLDSPTM